MPSFASMPSLSLPQWFAVPLHGAISRLEFALDPRISLRRLRKHHYSWRNEGQYIALALLAIANLSYIASPGPLIRLAIVAAYITGLLVPLTSQFILPATPIFSWLVFYWSSKYTPQAIRPSHIWVSVLPTLESVLYGANISDILTRITNPVLDILAWIPYGILHFSFPFVTAALIWIFGPPGAVKFFAKVFGYVNVIGVGIQIFFPSTPPWYELRHGMTPANYGMKGSPGGLGRIDAIFGGNGYTVTFTNSPMPFGAFPSLHAGCSTADALLLNHFFPQFKPLYVLYVLWLYWSTMYLTHHYLIDLVAGAALAVSVFYFFINEDPIMRDWQLHFGSAKAGGAGPQANRGVSANGYTFPPSAASGEADADMERALNGEATSAQDYELPVSAASSSGAPASGGTVTSSTNPFLSSASAGPAPQLSRSNSARSDKPNGSS